MNDSSRPPDPGQRKFEAVIPPEKLAADRERGGAEEAAPLGLGCLLFQLLLEVGVLDAGKNPLRIKP